MRRCKPFGSLVVKSREGRDTYFVEWLLGWVYSEQPLLGGCAGMLGLPVGGYCGLAKRIGGSGWHLIDGHYISQIWSCYGYRTPSSQFPSSDQHARPHSPSPDRLNINPQQSCTQDQLLG
jgi:hypothetical protein